MEHPQPTLVRRAAHALLPPALAWLVSWGWLAHQSTVPWNDLFSSRTWGRWDSRWYVFIARSGYTAVWHCGGHSVPPHLPPGNYLCGTISWFPGYPAAIRAVAAFTPLSLNAAALAIAWLSWFAVLAVMWQLLRDSVSTRTRLLLLVLAAFSPGQIYFLAIFPISFTVAALLGCLYFAFHVQRRGAAAAAFVLGAVAGTGYISALAFCPALALGAVWAAEPRIRRAAAAGAAGVAAGFAAVLVTAQITTGIWDGYFIANSKFATGSHMPLVNLTAHLRPLWRTKGLVRPHLATAQATQTAFATALVLFVLAVAAFAMWRRPRDEESADGATQDRPGGSLVVVRRSLETRISAFDVTLLVAAVGAWLIPYTTGGRVSVWRSEAFVVVCIPLLRRLPARVVLVPVIVAVYVSWRLTPFFFNGQLV
ncbi:MAG: hypothetical protein M3Y44_16205 [Actinomycetota bacterium]|nr:hypothetical protein [Actinomycetota bacterium]